MSSFSRLGLVTRRCSPFCYSFPTHHHLLLAPNFGSHKIIKRFQYTRVPSDAPPTVPLDFHVVVNTPNCIVATKPVNTFGMNQYLVGCKHTGRAALVDCGDRNPKDWINLAAMLNLKIDAILQTHAHIDHVMGLLHTKLALPHAPIYIHPSELVWMQGVDLSGNLISLRNICTLWARFVIGMMIRIPGIDCNSLPVNPDFKINDGEIIQIGEMIFETLFTPGHSPGHCVFYNAADHFAFVGDLLFDKNIGRTDFLYCNAVHMNLSLARMLTLPPNTRILPGHMNDTTIGEQKRVNPFLREIINQHPNPSPVAPAAFSDTRATVSGANKTRLLFIGLLLFALCFNIWRLEFKPRVGAAREDLRDKQPVF